MLYLNQLSQVGAGRASMIQYSTICYPSNTMLPTCSQWVSAAKLPKWLLLLLSKHPLLLLVAKQVRGVPQHSITANSLY